LNDGIGAQTGVAKQCLDRALTLLFSHETSRIMRRD
jgi:hypothetical protein